MITKPSLRATLMAMDPGQVERIPVRLFKHASVRNCACNLGFDLMRRYSVHLDRPGGCYFVTREQ